MAVKTAPASYFRLVERFPLACIRDDAHLKRAQAILDELLRARPDKGTELYLDALTDLVERYEAVHEPDSGRPRALREESGGPDGEEVGQCDDLRLRQRPRSAQDGRDRRLRDSDLGLQLLLGQSV